MAIGVVVGVAASSWAPGRGVLIIAVLGALAFRKSPSVVWVLLAVAVSSLRVLSFPLTPPTHDIGRLAGTSLNASALVAANPVTKGYRQQAVVSVARGKFHGRVLVSIPLKPALRPGDDIRIRGSLVRPRSLPGFDYRAYLAKDHIYATMPQAEVISTEHRLSLAGTLWDGRQDFHRRLTRLFPGTTGKLLLGILLGERSDMPAELTRDFQRTGLTHVLALSGYNISILLVVAIAMFGRRPAALLGALTAVGLFVMLVGVSASVLRAALMGGFIILSQLFGRPQEALRATLITAAVLLIISPWALRYDLSFDLSFTATLGIILFAPLIQPVFRRFPPIAAEAVTATLAASVLAAPLIILSFGQFSLIAPLANVVFVPAVPWLMLGGFMAAGLSYASASAAATLAYPVNLTVTALLGAVHRLSSLPLASLSLDHGRTAIALAVLLANLGAVGTLYARQHETDWLTMAKTLSARIRAANPRRPPEPRAAPG